MQGCIIDIAGEDLPRARQAIVNEALRWIGTPWRPCHAERLAGCDCLGLTVGVARAAGLPVPQGLPDRHANLLRPGMLETMVAQRLARQAGPARPGDLLGLCVPPRRDVVHLAILVPGGRIVHALSPGIGGGDGGVVLTRLDAAWHRRWIATWIMPGVEA